MMNLSQIGSHALRTIEWACDAMEYYCSGQAYPRPPSHEPRERKSVKFYDLLPEPGM